MDLWYDKRVDDLFLDEDRLDSVAMSFFYILGHTCISTAAACESDPMHFVYGTLATKTVLSPSDRIALRQAKEIALLFKLDETVFNKAQSKEICYLSVELSTTVGERSSTASEIQMVISRIVNSYTVILFRNESEYMLSFSALNSDGKASVVLSDWFCPGSHGDTYYESLAAFNFSFTSSTAFYADFRHAAARHYYTYPCSREFARYEMIPMMLFAQEERDYISRDDISDMVRNILLEPIRLYGDDYVDDVYLTEYSADELDDTDFDLLEYELEQMGAFDEDFQEAPFDDEVDLASQSNDSENPHIDTASIPADIMKDPVKLIKWLEDHEEERNMDVENHSPSNAREMDSFDELLIGALELEDLDYIDNRKKGGVFWIVGGQEIASFIAVLSKTTGYKFTFKAGGSSATTGEDAWWTK